MYTHIHTYIYRGRWDVAVKKMFDTADVETLADESEIHFLQRARHPRLVMFIGMFISVCVITSIL